MDRNQIIGKYTDFIFEIQIGENDFFIYSLKDFDFMPHDEDVQQDQIYLIFESLSKDEREIIFEINLGVDVLAVFERMVGHFKKTIRVECSEPSFEFSENSCIVLKEIISDIFLMNETFLNEESKDCIKTLEPYYFNNIRFL